MALPDVGVRLVAQDSDKFQSALGSAGSAVSNLGKIALGVGVAGIAAVVGVVGESISKAQEWAGTIRPLGKILGTTAEQSSALAVAIEGVGGSVDTFTSGARILSRGLESVNGKAGPSGKALEAMGIAFKDAHGGLIPVNDLLPQIADKLQQIPAGTERSRAEMQLFGRSGTDLDTIMSALANGGLAKADEKARKLGLSMSGDTLAAGKKMQLAMNDINLAIKGVFVSIGSQLLPILAPLLTQLAGIAENVVGTVIPAIQNFSKIIGDVAAGLGELFATGDVSDLYATLSDIFGPEMAGTISNVGSVIAGVFDTLTGKPINLSAMFPPEIVATIQNIVTGIRDVQTVIGNILAVVVPAITGFVSIKDVLLGLGIVIAATVVPALYSLASGAIAALLAALLPVIVPIVAIVGAVALLRRAWETDFGGIQEKVQAVLAGIGPVFQQIVTWLQTNIPVAIQKLSGFWTTTLQPAIATVAAWIQGTLIPILEQVLTWIGTNLPVALQKLSDFWNNTLLPAIRAVWGFIQDPLIPLLTSLANLTIAALSKALTALQGLWQNVLLPAIKDVWSFIQANIIPIFNSVVSTVNDHLGPTLQWLNDTILTPLIGAFGSVKSIIDSVIDAINKVEGAIAGIQLPSWLIPHSPETDLSLALWELNDAFEQMASATLPRFGASLAYTAQIYGGPGLGANTTSITNYNSPSTSFPLSVMTNQQSQGIVQDYSLMMLRAGVYG